VNNRKAGNLKKVSAVIPAWNEEGWVGTTVETLSRLKEIDEIIVVDDGSRDNTFYEALLAGATCVLRLPNNLGKGHALKQGTIVASGEIIIFVDADTQKTAGEVLKLLLPIINDETDMAIGSFSVKGGGGLGITKKLASWFLFICTGFEAKSPLSGQRVLTRVLLKSINFQAKKFDAEVALTTEALKKGFRVKEIPVQMSHRILNHKWQGWLHRAGQCLDILKYFWKYRGGAFKWTRI